jgi:hypothetical protein
MENDRYLNDILFNVNYIMKLNNIKFRNIGEKKN